MSPALRTVYASAVSGDGRHADAALWQQAEEIRVTLGLGVAWLADVLSAMAIPAWNNHICALFQAAYPVDWPDRLTALLADFADECLCAHAPASTEALAAVAAVRDWLQGDATAEEVVRHQHMVRVAMRQAQHETRSVHLLVLKVCKSLDNPAMAEAVFAGPCLHAGGDEAARKLALVVAHLAGTRGLQPVCVRDAAPKTDCGV